MSTPTIWRLRQGADRRFRGGHPWVYSNELSASPKGIEPGAPIELRDAKDQFLARGYGNPGSLIAFRAVSRDAAVTEPMSAGHLFQALQQARQVRVLTGLSRYSHRLCYGEADRLPGLVIDRYLLNQGDAQAYVIQAHTAGAAKMVSGVVEALARLDSGKSSRPGWDRTAIILRNDIGVRKLEGLDDDSTQVLKAVAGLELSAVKLEVAAAGGAPGSLEFATDLVGGQKTGFFLDQFANIQLTALKLAHLQPREGKKIRILDLCCYVGQWGAQLARLYREKGFEVEVTAVDGSDKALAFAKRNVEAQGARCETLRGDVLKDLAGLAAQGYDLVISDPPALIKGRKDVGPGTHAYLQLHTQAFRLARKGGAIVACSCSQLLDEEEFARTLTKAASRNGVDARWIGRGMQAPDHPVLTEFPEGRYLKCWIGAVL